MPACSRRSATRNYHRPGPAALHTPQMAEGSHGARLHHRFRGRSRTGGCAEAARRRGSPAPRRAGHPASTTSSSKTNCSTAWLASPPRVSSDPGRASGASRRLSPRGTLELAATGGQPTTVPTRWASGPSALVGRCDPADPGREAARSPAAHDAASERRTAIYPDRDPTRRYASAARVCSAWARGEMPTRPRCSRPREGRPVSPCSSAATTRRPVTIPRITPDA